VTEAPVAFDHVAIGVPGIAEAAAFLVEALGGAEAGSGPGIGFRFAQWRFANGGVIELLEPAGEPEGFLHRFLAQRGPGVHHVTFKVPDLEAAAERARAQGYEIVGWFDADPSWKECFLHPKQAQGIVVQLAESHPEHEGDPADWPRVVLPPRPADAPPPVALVGVRLAAHDAAAARHQWQDTLLARGREASEALLEFTWPGSPMRVAVEIRPDRPEGTLALEIATDRDPFEGAPAREALGTRFVLV